AWWTGHAARVAVRAEVEAELGGDDDFAFEGRERLADKFLVRVRSVNLGGVKKGDAAIHGGVQEPGHLLFVLRRAVGKAHAHAAQSDGRDFEVALAKFALLHGGVSSARLQNSASQPCGCPEWASREHAEVDSRDLK